MVSLGQPNGQLFCSFKVPLGCGCLLKLPFPPFCCLLSNSLPSYAAVHALSLRAQLCGSRPPVTHTISHSNTSPSPARLVISNLPPQPYSSNLKTQPPPNPLFLSRCKAQPLLAAHPSLLIVQRSQAKPDRSTSSSKSTSRRKEFSSLRPQSSSLSLGRFSGRQSDRLGCCFPPLRCLDLCRLPLSSPERCPCRHPLQSYASKSYFSPTF